MTHTTFYFDNNGTNFNTNNSFHKSTDYSAILDNIIATNIKETNPYLKDYTDTKSKSFIDNIIAASKPCYIDCSKKTDDFIKAANFLKNYSLKKYKKMPFTLGKTYKLIDGTPIIFYKDEIQIGLDLYSYSEFGDTLFLKKMTPKTKKLIIDIYNAGGADIEININ